MGIGENYEGNISSIPSDISRFSRGTVQKTPEAARMAFAMGRENGDWLCVAWPPASSDGGLKWQTWQTFAIPKSRLSSLKSGGREGIRTPGLLVANEALSQLSYSPTSSREILANVEREAKRVCQPASTNQHTLMGLQPEWMRTS